ncbi:MAG: hypothetical protein WC683_03895 [bacterium]
MARAPTCEECKSFPKAGNCRECFLVERRLLVEAMNRAEEIATHRSIMDQPPLVLAVVKEIRARQRTERWL